MARTRARPLPRGELTSLQTLVFAGIVGASGLLLLYVKVNALTMWLTLVTFVGYAIVYTVLLKPATPQNIVIGGASGAMPPVLGWAAVANDVAPEALLLFLDHFRVDAAALLVARSVPRAGIREGRAAHAARHARRRVHAPADRALHAGAVRGVADAVRDTDERLDLSRRGRRPGRRVHRLRGATLPALQRRACAAHFPLFDLLSRGAFFRAVDRPLLAVNFARILIIALLAVGVAACGPASPKFQGSDVTGGSFGRDFKLTDAEGRQRTLADFRGKVVVMFFGYTQCPDACPTTLSELAAVMQTLGPDAARVQVLFVTIDPERDTAELLAQYVPAFNPTFLGLRGDAQATAEVAKEFKVLYQKQPGTTPGTLQHGSFGRHVHLRSGGTVAGLRELWPGAAGFRARHRGLAAPQVVDLCPARRDSATWPACTPDRRRFNACVCSRSTRSCSRPGPGRMR